MAERRMDLYCRSLLIYFLVVIFYPHTKLISTKADTANDTFLDKNNLTERCSIQMQTKLDREPRLAKSEIGTNHQEEILLTLGANNGSMCMKLKGALSILVIYKKSNFSKKIDGYIFSRIVPSNAIIEGNCEQEDMSFIRITWNEYTLVWNFAKTPGRKRWYVNQIDLIINTRTEGFRKFAFCGKSFTFSTTEPIFPTPLGYSYRVFNKTALNLSLTEGKDVSPTANFTAQIYLKENFQLQPFMNGGDSNFGPLFDLENEIFSSLGTATPPDPEISQNFSVDETFYDENYTTTISAMEINETLLNMTGEERVVYSLHDFGPFKCAVLKAEGLIEISFNSSIADNNVVSTYMPNDAIVEGSCLANEAWMRVSWEEYSMKWSFVQEELEGWWVNQIEVLVCTKNELFQNISVSGEPIKLYKNETKFIFKGLGCVFESDEFVVDLTSDQEIYSQYNLSGKIILRNFQLVAFLIYDN